MYCYITQHYLIVQKLDVIEKNLISFLIHTQKSTLNNRQISTLTSCSLVFYHVFQFQSNLAFLNTNRPCSSVSTVYCVLMRGALWLFKVNNKRMSLRSQPTLWQFESAAQCPHFTVFFFFFWTICVSQQHMLPPCWTQRLHHCFTGCAEGVKCHFWCQIELNYYCMVFVETLRC